MLVALYTAGLLPVYQCALRPPLHCKNATMTFSDYESEAWIAASLASFLPHGEIHELATSSSLLESQVTLCVISVIVF